MNELEQHIRKLTLREPGDSLDQRVLSSLQVSVEVAPGESDHVAHKSSEAANARLMSSPLMSESTRMRRGIFSGPITGLVGALVIGMAIGNGLPSVWSRFGDSLLNGSSSLPTNKSVQSAPDVGSGHSDAAFKFPDRHPMMPELSMHLRDALQNRPNGSQFVESSYFSAIVGASHWERQNGEKFNVTTHVSDRRFDMCRDCHRVGG